MRNLNSIYIFFVDCFKIIASKDWKGVTQNSKPCMLFELNKDHFHLKISDKLFWLWYFTFDINIFKQHIPLSV